MQDNTNKSEMSPEEARAWLQCRSGLTFYLDRSTKGLKGVERYSAQDKHDRQAVEDCPKLAAIAARSRKHV